MINVTLEKIKNRFYVRILGHANKDILGKDIVCAGVSSLAQAFLYYIKELDDLGKTNVIECNQIEGIELIVEADNEGLIVPAFAMLQIGLIEIASQYPDYVCLKNNFTGGRNKKIKKL